jgi:GTP-sensing pleiotropic transcriptional regulator CodY
VWEFEDGYEISLVKSVEAKEIEKTYANLVTPSRRVLEFSAHLTSRRKVVGKSINQHVNYDEVTERKYLRSIEEFSGILNIVEQKSYKSFRNGRATTAASYALSAGIVLLF